MTGRRRLPVRIGCSARSFRGVFMERIQGDCIQIDLVGLPFCDHHLS